MKSLKDLFAFDAGEVEEIVDSDVRAVAAVDRPATDRRWRYFKAASGITTRIPDDNQETPAGLEADSSLTPLLKPDVAGNDAEVPTLEKVYREIEDALEKGVLGKATFDECVQQIMDQPGFEPKGGRTPEESAAAICATKPGGPNEGKAVPPDVDRATFERCIQHLMDQGHEKSSAFAICTAGGAGAGKEVGPMKRAKDEVAAAPPPPPQIDDVDASLQDVPQAPETIEIPATPTEWKLGDCVNQATELGMDHQQAVNACAIVYGEYGDPADEQTILVPEGNTPEGLLNGAAMRMGLKMKFDSPPEKVKFTGRNFWENLYKRFLGRRTRSGAVEYLKGLESRLEEVMAEQRKSKDDLRYVVDRMLGAITQQSQTMAALAGVPVAPVTPAPEPEPVAEEKSAPAAGAKDGAAAGAPVSAPADGTEQRLAALEQAMQQILAAVTGGGAVPEPDDDEADVALTAASPVMPAKRVSIPTPGINRLAVGAKSLAPAAGGTQYSTMYGVQFSATERAAAINNSKAMPRIGRK